MTRKAKNYSQENLLKAQTQLKTIKEELKKEFFGIDPVIDSVIESMTSWYLFPELQERPLVVNLWGLTGVGKTSLVERLVELLHLKDQYFYYNLSLEEERTNSLSDTLLECYQGIDREQALIISLDELQHAKSKEEQGREIENEKAQNIWSFIDTGKIKCHQRNYQVQNVSRAIKKYETLLLSGVVVKQGKITSNIEDIQKIDNEYYESIKENKQQGNYFFIEPYHLHIIRVALPYLFAQSKDAEAFFSKFNGKEIIEELKRIVLLMNKPIDLDFSDSLIFVMGNIDEAYQMAGNMNPDISANEFYKMTKKMNISHIKKALQKRFRNEQIARLGNIHILYPALHQRAYQQIITAELQKLSTSLKAKTGVDFYFNESVHELIYREGVFPTQGTRPLFSSVYKLVKIHMASILKHYYLHKLQANAIVLNAKQARLEVSYLSEDKEVETLEIALSLDVEKARTHVNDEMKTIVAAHEAGHAVLHIALLHQMPELVLATTADTDTGGLMMGSSQFSFFSKKDMLAHLAVFFGGIAAEELVFGKENITAGSASDLGQATEMVLGFLKRHGLGSRNGAYQSKIMMEDYFCDAHDLFFEEAEILLLKAKTLALKILKEEELFLYRMIESLLENPKLEVPQLEILAANYMSSQQREAYKAHEKNFYQESFKEKLAQLNRSFSRENKVLVAYQDQS